MKFLIKLPYVLFVIRLLVGITFLLHGSQKLFGLFGGSGIEPFAAYVHSLGFPMIAGYIAAWCEFIGGILITAGIATEIGAALIVPLMIVAIFWVHRSHGYFIQNNGYEYALTLLVLLLCLLASGPGAYALWDPFKGKKQA
jgi:putative oxidoreductase